MQVIRQADRQWLNYLYSLSPGTGFDHFLFQTYYRFRGTKHRQPPSELRTKITSIVDRYGSVVWHAYNPVLKTSISTYSEPELQRWRLLQAYLDSGWERGIC